MRSSRYKDLAPRHRRHEAEARRGGNYAVEVDEDQLVACGSLLPPPADEDGFGEVWAQFRERRKAPTGVGVGGGGTNDHGGSVQT